MRFLIFSIVAFLSSFALALPSSEASIERRADTPNFYLVASSADASVNPKPVRLGPTSTSTTFDGTGAIVKFNFEGGS